MLGHVFWLASSIFEDFLYEYVESPGGVPAFGRAGGGIVVLDQLVEEEVLHTLQADGAKGGEAEEKFRKPES